MFDDDPVREPPPAEPEPEPAPVVIQDRCEQMRAVVTRDGQGALSRVLLRTDKGLLTFDTGAPKTQLTHDSSQNGSEIQNAGAVRLFCEQTTLSSMPQSPLNAGGWQANGERVIGTLGTDILDHGVLEVDAKRRFFELHPVGWHPDGRFVRVPLWFTKGIIVTKAEIEGASHWVQFDTGGWLTMLFDPSADMSPPVIPTHDWLGNAIAFKETRGQMTLGDGPERSIRLQRTNHYPVFEGWMRTTGIDGAIGLDSIASEHFVVDRGRGESLLEPR
jgi:hypothetical protein